MPITVTGSTGTSTAGTWGQTANWGNDYITISAAQTALEELQSKGLGPTTKIHATLYFKYVKSKFKLLENVRMGRRVKVLEKAFDKAAKNGQDMLASKILNEVTYFGRTSVLSAKGIKYMISREDLNKYKRKIKGGHISDTPLQNFTRVIPDKVLKRLEEVKPLFDSFVIYHYWNEKAEEGSKDMTPDEKSAMRDPVLFGQIKEAPDMLFFVADWEDEFCDLTFDEMVEAMGKEYSDVGLPTEPDFT